MKTRLRSRLALRLYALGLVQLLLFAGFSWLVGFVGDSPGKRIPPLVADTTRDVLVPLLDRPDDMKAKLTELRAKHGTMITVIEDDGTVISNVEPALPAPNVTVGDTPVVVTSSPPSRVVTRYRTATHRGLLVVQFPPLPFPLKRSLLTWASGLLVLALGALFTGRWLVRPLGKLSRAAERLGTGDLDARAEVQRKDEIGDVATAFDEMAVRLKALLLSEKELLANVSHELRTPLARIRVALDLAVEGDAAAAREALAEIAVDLAELEGLIDDILTTTRLELGSRAAEHPFVLRPEESSAAAISAQAAERFRVRHPSRPLELEVDADLPSLCVDPHLVRRAIDNLLENAHKYSPDGSAKVRLLARREGDQVVFDVKDEGIGIRADELPHVFVPFFRADRSRSRGTGGVGLGLTLAKRIVEAHGGTIAIDSTVDRGTRVHVALPAS